MGTSDSGWPFLVASGRRRDYSILLAPDFLVDELDYGILEEVVSPASERDPARVVQVDTRGGRRLSIAYATHLLSGEDVGEPARDEHGRPLRLVHGFVSRDGLITEPAPADLAFAREAALEAYRRFLEDEEQFAVVPAPAFPLRSRTTGEAETVMAAEGTSRPAPSAVKWLAVVAIATALVLMALFWSRPAAPPECPVEPVVSQSAAPTPASQPSPSGCVPQPTKGA
ncbi:MAG: hypothetical protein ACRDTM_01400 [Micromonosporaceae bacterium]